MEQVIRVAVSITESSRANADAEPAGLGHQAHSSLGSEGLVREHVSEAMAERLATVCLSNTIKLLKASPTDIKKRLELDWGRDVQNATACGSYEYGDDALKSLANALVKANGGGTANISTLNLRHNQRVSRAACTGLEPIFAAAGVRCVWPAKVLALQNTGPSLQRQPTPPAETRHSETSPRHAHRTFTKV